MNAARGVRPGGWGGFHPMLRTGGLSIRPLQKKRRKKLVRFILILFGYYSGLDSTVILDLQVGEHQQDFPLYQGL